MLSLVTVGSFNSSLLHLVACNMTLLINSFLISGGFILGWHIGFIPFRKLIPWSWASTCSLSVTFVSSTLKHPSSSHYQLAHCLVFCCHCFTLPCSTKLSFSFLFFLWYLQCEWPYWWETCPVTLYYILKEVRTVENLYKCPHRYL